MSHIFPSQSRYALSTDYITTKRKTTIYYDRNGNKIDDILVLLHKPADVRKEETELEVNEGDTSDYWLATAANAIKPLYQLIALAKMRPDCIWDGD